MSNQLERNFVEGAARAMYVQAWADREEETCADCGAQGESGADGRMIHCDDGGDCETFRRQSFAGVELMDVAPPTPDYAREEAWKLLGRLVERNHRSLAAITAAAARADAADGPDVPAGERAAQLDDDGARTFGHYIAMSALGHGVSWFDDHASFELNVPDIDFELED